MKSTKQDALIQLYHTINGPVKAGPVWVQYSRQQIDAALDVLKQILQAEGVEFRKEK